MPNPVAIETLPHTQGLAEVRFEAQFVSSCPVPNLPFVGKVKVTYAPQDLLLEFMSVENWLKGMKLEGTLEDIAAYAYDTLFDVVQPRWLRVEASAVAVVHSPATAIKDSRIIRQVRRGTCRTGTCRSRTQC